MIDYARQFGVKQFVAAVKNERGGLFMVFTCGNDRYWLFQPCDANGSALGDALPVLRKNVRDDVRCALNHGWGNGCLGGNMR